MDTTLYFLSAYLRGEPAGPGDLPDLRESHHALISAGDPKVERYALVNVETDRVTNSLNTLALEVVQWVAAEPPDIAIDNIATPAIIGPMSGPDPSVFLPLPPATFHILLAVADEDRHGYAIIQDVAARTGGELKLSAGTLYRSVQRMLEQGLIVEPRERPEPELDDERRRYYRITPFGRAVAEAESRRLTQLLRMARQRGFAPGRS